MRESDPRIVLGLHRSRYERRILTSALELGIDAIDTSFNYRGFSAHSALAEIGSDLLPRFTLSTKVGFFPAAGQAEHSLDPGRLRRAMEQTNRDLGRAPDLVFLHNPERSLTGSPNAAKDALAMACTALAVAATEGLCGAWGISSWDPRPLRELAVGSMPRPDALMVRGGLLAGIDVLEASETLAARWDLGAGQLWGMSPFGGKATDPLWGQLDPQVFIQDPDDGLSALQAAFRTAYWLPQVGRVAVGTDNPSHLRELVDALRYKADARSLRTYRRLLCERAGRQPV
ncbi:aldo/keto reductase [Streptomyces sp. AK02-01A]|uniref:aldo/keto reductase n=1 Tax=Streptomyces sp. AK02-01A TaxID=3028648 RepID=UPI0029A84837|nr:aldo/keto reductase [Streptomyces sp. AK02-01A]MDX3851045.1 aldo/keto reductase [Streptomyces sp. AK02-01A]